MEQGNMVSPNRSILSSFGLLCAIVCKPVIRCTWNNAVNQTCVLCNEADETYHHLFFSCRYTKQIWKTLVGGILQGTFTTDWNEIIEMISNPTLTPTKTFLLRYTFQATVHVRFGGNSILAGMVNSRNIQPVSLNLWTRQSGLDCYQLKGREINIWKKDWSFGLDLVKSNPKLRESQACLPSIEFIFLFFNKKLKYLMYKVFD